MPTTKFCTIAQVRAQLNDADGYSGDDAAVTEHIKQATALIRVFTRRNWETGSREQFFTTHDINIAINEGRTVASFTLDEKPLQSITAVKFHTGGEWDDTTALDSTLYAADTQRNAMIMYPFQMRSSMRSLQVTYVAGYEVDDTDTDLLLVDQSMASACALQAATTYRRVLNQSIGTDKSITKSGERMDYNFSSAGLVKEAQALLRGTPKVLVGRY